MANTVAAYDVDALVDLLRRQSWYSLLSPAYTLSTRTLTRVTQPPVTVVVGLWRIPAAAVTSSRRWIGGFNRP